MLKNKIKNIKNIKNILLIAFLCSIGGASMAENMSVADQNLSRGRVFLENNKTKPGVVTLSTGLQYRILKDGAGNSPGPTDRVTVNYEGKTLDGNEFDSSYKRGQPATFGVNEVIQGWQQALQIMKPGSEWEVYLPPQLAYGEYNVPNIGPNQVLIFKIALISVQKAG